MVRRSPQTERIVDLMAYLAGSPKQGRTLADVARRLGVDKPTCYPMMIELLRSGWLVRDPQRKEFRLGPALMPIGVAAAEAVEIVEMARPHLRALADETGLTCLAVSRSDDDLVVSDVILPLGKRDRVTGLRVGDRMPLRPPLGAVFVASGAPAVVELWLDRGAAANADAPHWRDGLREQLAIIRRRSFAVEHNGQARLYQMAGEESHFRREAGSDRESSWSDGSDVLIGELDPDQSYTPYSISAAAFDPMGQASLGLVLRLDYPRPLPVEEIERLGSLVVAAARQVTAAVRGGTA